MDVQDLTQNLRIARLETLTRELGQSRTPDQTLRALQQAFSETRRPAVSVLLSTRGLASGQYRVVRAHLTDGPESNVPAPASEEQEPVRSGGIVAAITARREPQLIQNVDWSQDPSFHDLLRGYTSVIAVPISADHLPMNWSLLLKRAPERFDVSDLENAVERAALVGALLENQFLESNLERVNQQIDREARQLGELQRALLPSGLPRFAGLEVAANYRPSGRAGGDLYDLFPLEGQNNGHHEQRSRWCVFIGDTAGHGLPAALFMVMVQAVLRAHPARIARPATLLRHANRQLCGKPLGGFVTAFLGVYEPGQRRLIYANAGHPPPLLKHAADGSIQTLDEVASYPLGINESESFEEAAMQLKPADMVLLYTDGIVEARNKNGDEFERDRLMRVFREAADRPAGLVHLLSHAVRKHEQGQSPRDDQTLVAAWVL